MSTTPCTQTSRSRAFRATPLAVAGALLLAACSGGSSDTDATESNPTTTDSAETTQPDDPDEPDTETSEPAETTTTSPVVGEPEPEEAEPVAGVACDSEPEMVALDDRRSLSSQLEPA